MSNWKNDILKKLICKVAESLTRNFKHRKRRLPTLEDPDVLVYLQDLQKKFVIVTVDKALNNFAFICKRFNFLRNYQ